MSDKAGSTCAVDTRCARFSTIVVMGTHGVLAGKPLTKDAVKHSLQRLHSRRVLWQHMHGQLGLEELVL